MQEIFKAIESQGIYYMAVDDGETVIIPRKEDRSVAIISLNDYNAMQKTIKMQNTC